MWLIYLIIGAIGWAIAGPLGMFLALILFVLMFRAG